MKNWYLKRHLCSFSFAIVLLVGLVTANAADLADTDQYWQTNKAIAKSLEIPFYFTAPYQSFLPLPHEMVIGRNGADQNSAFVFPYRESGRREFEVVPEHAIGLRLITVRADLARKLNSAILASSGIFETGDVLLSFRKEWFGTLKYSHIQLGVSHAGLIYFEKGPDGKRYLKNLDMPLDAKHVGEGYLNSEHYLGAPMLHVIRAKDLTKKQKENLNGWLQRLAKKGAAAYKEGQLQFNTDYSAPKYRKGEPMKFVANLGRIALGITNSETLTNYCSEFVWSALSLRDCDPEDKSTVKSFSADIQPKCISEIFAPMPVLGTVTTAVDKKNPELTVGLADGIPLLTEHKFRYIKDAKMRNAALDRLLTKSVFEYANGNPANISSGHRAVEAALLEQNPDFFKMLGLYFALVNDENADEIPQVKAIRAGFNQAQPLNYSPTAFMVHALLASDVAIKRMDYVGTIVYAPKVSGRNGTKIESYDIIRRAKQ